jgi:hypothetical protein
MRTERIADRAVAFANNVRKLNRFLVSDRVTDELYGFRRFVLDERNLRSYYERHEPIAEWRDFETFRVVIERRIECVA